MAASKVEIEQGERLISAINAVALAGGGVAATSSLLKGDGAGGVTAATQGTDYWKPGGTDVAVADGGTGASSASAARTALGLVINTDVAGVPILDSSARTHDLTAIPN